MTTWNESMWFAMFVGVALKSTAVLGLAWLVTILLRLRSAALRHLVWTAAAAAVLAMPFLSLTLPSMSDSAGRNARPRCSSLVRDHRDAQRRMFQQRTRAKRPQQASRASPPKNAPTGAFSF